MPYMRYSSLSALCLSDIQRADIRMYYIRLEFVKDIPDIFPDMSPVTSQPDKSAYVLYWINDLRPYTETVCTRGMSCDPKLPHLPV
jgi:hypothetical protein